MKKIINGKKYDTATAKELGTAYGGGASTRDFSYWCETLYKKKTGEYFLLGVGGPMSKYAVSCGQCSRCGAETIVPISLNDAKIWFEKHLDADEYESEFGEVEE